MVELIYMYILGVFNLTMSQVHLLTQLLFQGSSPYGSPNGVCRGSLLSYILYDLHHSVSRSGV